MTPRKFDWTQFSPGDGFQVVELDMLDLSLHVELRSGKEIVPINPDLPADEQTAEVARWVSPTPADRGDCARLGLVMDAVCRYLNTGGSWEQLGRSLSALRRVVPGGLSFPGYRYVEGVFNTDMVCEHLFVREPASVPLEDTPAVLWVEEVKEAEGGFVDTTKTLGQIREEQKKYEENKGPRRVRPGGGDGMELPDSPDPGLPQLPG